MITQSDLKQFIACFEPAPPRTTALEQKIKIGTGYHGKWYRSQREHWLGWMFYQDAKAHEKGKDPGVLPAKPVWNRLKCSPSMFWLAEASGVSSSLLDAAEDAAIRATLINPKDGNPHGRLMREVLPWGVIDDALFAGVAKLPIDETDYFALQAFERLASLRSEFRQYLPDA
ncbi:hypothetical protein [Falsihalocynthiibacter arcticus]|uniref:Uncharacterized protein n=1 Tax=Falsihalocynthiibacter arcticus TaxID=1579316 RepID=A0A126V3E2_9RHOB|nr:hypothetical protein [Falsihalocynthiibacter arcticus]AML52828.1 hypothetical protein RC74_17585 [Falsihalocynthiibacter arcticus]